MIDYILFDVKENINNQIGMLVQDICKENKINYIKQDYKILFSNERMFIKNNEVKFTSGSKKDLSFYGKVYLNKKGRVVENIFLPDNTIEIEPNEGNAIIICGGLDNSTVVEVDQELLYFYIAPNHLLAGQEPGLWQSL